LHYDFHHERARLQAPAIAQHRARELGDGTVLIRCAHAERQLGLMPILSRFMSTWTKCLSQKERLSPLRPPVEIAAG